MTVYLELDEVLAFFFFLKLVSSSDNLFFLCKPIWIKELSAWSFYGSIFFADKCEFSLLLPSRMASSAISIPFSIFFISISISSIELLFWISFSLFLDASFRSFSLNSSSYLLLLNFMDSIYGLVISKVSIPPTWRRRCFTLLNAIIIFSSNLAQILSNYLLPMIYAA